MALEELVRPRDIRGVDPAAPARVAAASTTTDATVSSSAPLAARAPAAKSSESPGRNGVTTSPVSAKTMAKRIA
jgi:hypothetical protein